jgi:hypothetical protein
MGNDGIFVSDSQPDHPGKITWLKINPDGSKEWYEREEGEFSLVKSESAPVSSDHTHPNLDHLADIVNLLNGGITGSKTIGGYTFTFNHGVLVGFEEA